MRFALVALMLLGTVACERALARLPSNSLAWRQFKQQHGKVHASQEEDARRFAIFVANKERIELHNANPSASFTMGLNHLADWTSEELEHLNGAKLFEGPADRISESELADIIGQAGPPVPDEVDWRKVAGRVSSVKDQGKCGSCWAFATTGLLEGQELAQNMSLLVDLSEQEILDCSKSNLSCLGGFMPRALDDLANTFGGIESETDYPYIAQLQKCKADKSKFLPLKVRGHKMLPKGDEKTLKQVVANYGPVAVAFDVSLDFLYYQDGIYENEKCDKERPNHAVLIVGYGKDAKKGDYWIVKNSWSAGWGENGYFRMKAGVNICGLASFATIATF